MFLDIYFADHLFYYLFWRSFVVFFKYTERKSDETNEIQMLLKVIFLLNNASRGRTYAC